MPINKKYIEPFVENEFMHICCKAVGNTLLFRCDENKHYFLKKYASYSNGYMETYSYILLDNHAHLLVKSNSEKKLTDFINSIPARKQKSHQKKYIKKEFSFEQAVEFQCKDFFIAYAMAYNKQYNRDGSFYS